MLYSKTDLSYLESAAESFVMENDRAIYQPFIDAAIEFCKNNPIIIGGTAGINLLLDHPKDKNQLLELFTDNAFARSQELAIQLSSVKSPHVSNKTVALQTNLKHREFTIMVNTRMLIKIYAMDPYRGVPLIKFMEMPHNGLKLMSPELQLIEIYHNLYNPAKADLWESSYAIEQQLFGVNEGVNEDINSGVNEGTIDIPHEVKGGRPLNNLHKLLKLGIVIGGNYFLRGQTQKVQLLTATPIDELTKIINRTLGINTTVVKYHLNLTLDFQLTKHTFYHDKIPIADIFNAPEFELIPFTDDGKIRRANPWVVLRFIYIDIWIRRLMAELSGKNADNSLKQLRDDAAAIRKIIHSDPTVTFQLENYEGTYINEMVAKKKLIKDVGIKFPVFYPAMNSVAVTRGGNNECIPLIKSSAIDPTIDVSAKKSILRKIAGRVNNDLLGSVYWYAKQARAQNSDISKWSVNKTIEKFPLSNAAFVPWISESGIIIHTYIDIGCGSGSDIIAMSNLYKINEIICVDVNDFRIDAAKSTPGARFLQAVPGQNLALDDASADLITVFHTLHHMNDNISDRITDYCRILRPGGLLMIKDHDVDSAIKASNVDFEHFVYMIGESDADIPTLMKDFPKHEPMNYYSMSTVSDIVVRAGFDILESKIISARNYSYAIIARKI